MRVGGRITPKAVAVAVAVADKSGENECGE